MSDSAGSSGSSEPTGSGGSSSSASGGSGSDLFGGSGSSDNQPSTNKDASGNEMSSGASHMLVGEPSTNKRDSQGNLVDASGNVITWNNEGSWLKFLKSLLHFFILSLLILCQSGYTHRRVACTRTYQHIYADTNPQENISSKECN